MKTKLLFIALLLIFLLPNAFALETTYKLLWNTNKLNIDVRTALASEVVKGRVSENGAFTPAVPLPIKQQLPNGTLILNNDEEAYIYILVKNLDSKLLRFSVAPHSTTPGASALGFSFNCLCNGHVYEVKPGEIWYRIMSLKNNKYQSEKNIILVHDIFRVDSAQKKMTGTSHHH